jgi:prolyl oligopeptidase
LAIVLWMAMTGGCSRLQVPAAVRGNAVDVFHGVTVPDPYRGLEYANSEDTRKWVDAENRLTEAFVAGSTRERIESELTKLWDFPRYTAPHREGDRYFYEKNNGLQSQNVIYRIDRLGGEPKVVIDPSILSTDGTIALEAQTYSFDGKLLAYGLSTSGSDRQEIHVRDIDSGKDIPDLVRWTKFTSIAWKHNNSGFYYNRFRGNTTTAASITTVSPSLEPSPRRMRTVTARYTGIAWELRRRAMNR